MTRFLFALFAIALAGGAFATATPSTPASPSYKLPERDDQQDAYDRERREVERLRLQAEKAELLARIAKATGDTTTPSAAGLPELTAILVKRNGSIAYFRDGKRTVKARLGDRVAGEWLVREFLPNSVRLEHATSGSVYVASIGAKSPTAPDAINYAPAPPQG